MKTIKFFSAALLSSVLLVSSAFASEGTKSSSSENSIREQISSTLSDVASESKGSVFIYFSVSSSKGFELLNVSGTDAALVNKVKKQFKDGSISAPEGLKGTYMLKVVFVEQN